MKHSKTRKLPILFGAILFTAISSCDTDKDLFDPEKVKQEYEKTFPVKNIDSGMTWKTTQSVQVNISVNEDWGTDYKVQIFDANPLDKDSHAKLIAEGYATQDMPFLTTVDWPLALQTAFVARVNEKGQYLVQPVPVESNAITAVFGTASQVQSARTRAGESTTIPAVQAPYTAAEITTMLAGATEVVNNWDLTSNVTTGIYAGYDIFTKSSRVFKITDNTYKGFASNTGGMDVKLIITSDNVRIPENLSNSLEIIVASGAILNLGNASYTLPNECRITTMPGGKVIGAGATITYSNHSGNKLNYNGGTIDIKELKFNSGDGKSFYNYGTLKVQTYSTSNSSTFVNRGTALIGSYTGVNSSVQSACYMEVTNALTCTNIKVGTNSMLKCGSLPFNGEGGSFVLEKNAMLNCLGSAKLNRQITGPTDGSALFKLKEVTGNLWADANSAYIRNNIICEVTTQTSNAGKVSGWSSTAKYTWSLFDWLVYGLLQNGATYCNPDKANFILPDGECTGEGYHADEFEDDVIPDPIAYTYAYEDNFPYPGDYDFNDVVFEVTPKYIRNTSNKIQKVAYTVTLKAIGGIKMHGAALRVVGVNKSQITQIEFSDPSGMRNTLGNALFANVVQESEDTRLVIPLFGDAHKIVGMDQENPRPLLNTTHGGPSFTPVSLTMTLTFADQTKTAPILTNDNLDFFIGYPGTVGLRTEVHLYEFRSYGATAKGTVHDQNIAVAGKVTWAVCVPGFKYPTERTVITSAYPNFEKWATTGGLNPEYANWYQQPTTEEGKIY